MLEDQAKQENDGQETGRPESEIESNEVEPIKSKDSPQKFAESSLSGETEGKSDSTIKDGDSTSTNFNIHSIEGSGIIANNMKNQFEAVNKTIIEGVGGISFRIKKFSTSDTIPIEKNYLEEADQTFVYPNDEIEQFVSALNSKRILLLAGQPEYGKFFTAKYLANRISKQYEVNYDVLLVKPQARECIVDLFGLIDDLKLKNKIIIFKDIFLKKNQSLLDFFNSYEREQTILFSKKLKELNAYIIFTSDIDPPFDKYKMSGLDITRDISSIGINLLEEGFYRKLKHFCSIRKIDFDNVFSSFNEKKNEILTQLNRMSKVSLFIENYLDKILVDSNKIGEAIEEVNDIKKRVEHWFLKELGENKEEFETWVFVLCLSLLNGASYVDFERICQGLTEKLLRIISPYRPLIKFSFTLSESNLLAKSKAQITRNSDDYADIIEFCDPQYQEILLDTLFKNYRRIFLSIIPYLQEYVDNQYQWSLRRLAGYSIGRIGELDLDSITLHFIKKWQYKQEDFYKVNVGYLFAGILDSKDENYKKFCIGYLKNMGIDTDIRVRWTAISAYKQIGVSDLELAMNELRKILENTIDQMIKSESILDILYQEGVSEDEILGNLDTLYEKTGYLWANIRYSVIALCFMVGPIKVLSELKKWIEKGNRNTKITVLLFFLGTDGILHAFDNRKIIILSIDDEDSLSSNILLNSFTLGNDAIREMALFIKALYEKCFPQFLRSDQEEVGYKELKLILLDHLQKWIIDTLFKSKVNDALKMLLVELFNSGDKDFQRTLYESIKRWRIPDKKEKKEDTDQEEREKEEKKKTKLKAFIDDVTNRMFDIN